VEGYQRITGTKNQVPPAKNPRAGVLYFFGTTGKNGDGGGKKPGGGTPEEKKKTGWTFGKKPISPTAFTTNFCNN